VDLLRGGREADELTGGGDRDRFAMAIDESEGDVITDFEGAGAVGGDVRAIAGFGKAATIASAGGDLWTVSDGAGNDETFQIVGVTSLSAGDDYIFV
jgi:Ca2+-binding RTX toxin-like protein